MRVHAATDEDRAEVERLAKLSKYTKGATNPRYLDGALERSEVGIVKTKAGKVVGFALVRHLQRKEHTSLYYIGVDPKFQGKGIGSTLIEYIFATSPWDTIELICEKENRDTVSWYVQHGFEVSDEGENAAGQPYWRLRCSIESWAEANE